MTGGFRFWGVACRVQGAAVVSSAICIARAPK